MKFSQIVALTIVSASPMALATESLSLASLSSVPAETTIHPLQLTITGLPSHLSKHSKSAAHTKSEHSAHSRATGTGEHHHPKPTHHPKHNETHEHHPGTKSGFSTKTRDGEWHCIEVPLETKTGTLGPKETSGGPEPRDHARRWVGEEFEKKSVGSKSGHAQPTGGRRICFPGHLPPIRPGESHASGVKPTGTRKVIGPLRPTLHPTGTGKVIGPVIFPSETATASRNIIEPIESPRPIPSSD